ncbi:MAG: hypothetical protein P8Y42_14995 [Exilibacterium sp.]
MAPSTSDASFIRQTIAGEEIVVGIFFVAVLFARHPQGSGQQKYNIEGKYGYIN